MSYMDLYQQMDKPFERFDDSLLGPPFAQELETVSSLWFVCGYRPGIVSYLNFFLLKDFIVKHDTSFPPRFKTFKAMGDSFYQTDLFIRDVTDSGLKPTGGISSPDVRNILFQIMARHQAIDIPLWMMTYFGFSLLEAVEKVTQLADPQKKQWHLQYMAKTYRLMGMSFSSDRTLIERFARDVEAAHAHASPNLEKHAKHILLLGEMAEVPSAHDSIVPFLPDKTRQVFEPLHGRVRPSLMKRAGARLLGRLLLKQAVGAPRTAVPN